MTYIQPADRDYIDGTVNATSITGGDAYSLIATITVDRTGYWAAAGHYHTSSGQEGASHQIYAQIRFAGTAQATTNMTRAANTNDGGVGVFSAPVLISSGQQITLYGTKDFGLSATIDTIGFRAWFMPAPGYVH